VVAPEVIGYSRDVKALAADELDALGPPCLRVEVAPGCSAVKTMIMDYKLTRDQIRALVD
jgi:hypothetical protein